MSWHVTAPKRGLGQGTEPQQQQGGCWSMLPRHECNLNVQAKRGLGMHTSHIYRCMRQWHEELDLKGDCKSSTSRSLDTYCNCSLSKTRTLNPSRSGWCHNLSIRVLVELGCVLLVWQGVGDRDERERETEIQRGRSWGGSLKSLKLLWEFNDPIKYKLRLVLYKPRMCLGTLPSHETRKLVWEKLCLWQ